MRAFPLLFVAGFALAACTGDKSAPSGDDTALVVTDADGDGFGSLGTHGDDCDDADADVHPGADETCDGLDQDCDGVVDNDAIDARYWYADVDGDTYGDPDAIVIIISCDQPGGYVADTSDCDDTTASVRPGAVEVCDGLDDDCDGTVDDDALDAATWYADADADGFGDALTVATACAAPDGYLGVAGDCDDAVAATNPAGVEVCDGVDQDCDGEVDEVEAVDVRTWYADTDGDGYGDASVSTLGCTPPAGMVADDTDCDDADATVSPSAEELCNTTDDDCDGAVDDEATDRGTWYSDLDLDGFGDPSSGALACDAPAGTVTDGTDCDDTDADVSPAATEVCNILDDNCDGAVDEGTPGARTWYVDADLDGYGDPATTVYSCETAHTVTDGTDCDDADPDVNPAATEVCNIVDDNCDGTVDEGTPGASTWYLDMDGDGYGDPTTTVYSCETTYTVTDASDCDDADPNVWPGAPERCDGVANDCDLASSWTDADEDGMASRFDADGLFAEDLTATLSVFGAWYSLPADGTVTLCRGTWAVYLSAFDSEARIVGPAGPADTVLDRTGTGDASTGVGILNGGRSDLSITGLTFTGGGNWDDWMGGAVALGSSTATFTDCVFTDNYSIHGGGFFVYDGSAVTLVDSLVYDNRSSGFFLSDATLTLVDTDVYDESTGIYLDDASTLACTSSTGTTGFYDNTFGVDIAGGSTVSSDNCYWGNTTADVYYSEMSGTFSDTWAWAGAATFVCDSTTGCY